MGRMVGIKNVDTVLFAEFKRQASSLGLLLGEAFNQAISLWLSLASQGLEDGSRERLAALFREGIERARGSGGP